MRRKSFAAMLAAVFVLLAAQCSLAAIADDKFTPPATLAELKEALGADAVMIVPGANAVTFVDGDHIVLTNSGTAMPEPTFARGQRIVHALYMVGGDGEIDPSQNGRGLKAEVSSGGRTIISKDITVEDGRASLELTVDEIVAAQAAAGGRSIAAEASGVHSLRIYSDDGGVPLDLTTRFTIASQDSKSSSGGCSAGAAILSLAALAVVRRRAKRI